MLTKTVYLAASYAERDRLRDEIAPALEADGWTITSRWLRQTCPLDDEGTPEMAEEDLEDVRGAHFFLCWPSLGGDTAGSAEPVEASGVCPPFTGGHHFELGYAVALGKQVYIVGRGTSLFHHLPGIIHVASAEDFAYAADERVTRMAEAREEYEDYLI